MVEAFLEWAKTVSWELGAVAVYLASLVEYLFPPFPGDGITIASATMTSVAQWPLPAIYLATVFGSTTGAMATFRVGGWIENHPTKRTWLHRLLARPHIAERVERAKKQFAKHGVWLLAVNRFVPALRAVFFVSAGMAGLSAGRVALCAVLSAAVFNALLFGFGFGVGVHLEELIAWTQTYSTVGLVVIVAIFFAWWFWPDSSKRPSG